MKKTALALSSVDTKRPIRIASVNETGKGNEWRQFTLGRLLLFAFTAYEERILEGYRAAGYPEVRQVHFNVTRHIDTEIGSRISDLAARAGVTKGAMGQLVADCERLGLVTRVSDSNDARATIVALSKRGRDLMEVTRRASREIEADFAAAVGTDAFAAVRTGLTALRDKLPSPNAR